MHVLAFTYEVILQVGRKALLNCLCPISGPGGREVRFLGAKFKEVLTLSIPLVYPHLASPLFSSWLIMS